MTAPRPASPTRSITALDLASLVFLRAVWGASFLFLRVAAPEVGAVWAAEARMAVGALVLLAFAGRRTLPVLRGRLVAFLIVGATFTALPFTFVAYATLTLPTGFAALLNAATPLFTAVLGVLVLRQRLAPRAVLGLGAGVAAVLVLVGWSPLALGPTTILAVASALGAPASYAVAGTYVRARLHGVGGLDGARLARVLPGAVAHDADGGEHGDLHRPRVRHPVGRARARGAGRSGARGRVRTRPREPGAGPGAPPVAPAAGPPACGPGTRKRRRLRLIGCRHGGRPPAGDG